MTWMCLISRNEVPLYLQSGELYKSFSADDDEPFLVPDDAVKPDISIADLCELTNLLISLRFWIVLAVPVEVLKFCLDYPENGTKDLAEVLLQFSDSLQYTGCIHEMCKVAESTKMTVAMRWGFLDIVQYLVGKGLDPMTGFADAAGSGHLHCLQFAHNHSTHKGATSQTLSPTRYSAKLSAIAGGHVHCLSFLHSIDAKWSANMCTEAACWGRLNCLKYLHESKCPWDSSTPLNAIKTGHVVCLYYALTSGCPHPENMPSIAIEAGQAAVLSCLHSLGHANNHNLTAIALAYKQLECFVMAHQLGCPCDPVLTRFSAITGQLSFLQYMHEQCGVQWDLAACTGAAANGQLDCLIYLHEHGAQRDEHTCAEAAAHGHIDCLQYLHEHGAPWSDATCIRAAAGGHLSCLRYAHEHGCRWSELTGRAAAQHGQLACLQYAVDHGSPCCCDAVAYTMAVAGGHTECAAYLLQLGCPIGLKLIKNGNLVNPMERANMRFDETCEL